MTQAWREHSGLWASGHAAACYGCGGCGAGFAWAVRNPAMQGGVAKKAPILIITFEGPKKSPTTR